jgi:sigma-B regulation protein RsbU (phosphoserine phosphatase)
MSDEKAKGLNLTDLLDVTALQEILDVFAAVTHTTVCVCDRDGSIIARPAGLNPLCKLMSQSEEGRQGCRESLQAILDRTAEQGRTVSVRCHAGMMQYASPVRVNGEIIATIVMGDLPKPGPGAEQIRALAERHHLDPEPLLEVFAQTHPWTEHQASAAVEFLQLLANRLARFCHQENQLRLRVDELATVYDITALMAGTSDVREVLRTAAESVAKVLRVKACSIRLLDEATGALAIAAGYNLSPEYLGKGPVRVEENPIDEAALNGKMVYIADVSNDPRIRYPAQAQKEGLVSGLVTGMVFRNRPVGVIRVYTGEPHVFSAFEASLLRAVGAQAAVAIENSRLTDQAIQAEILKRQIGMAAEVQRRMVPAEAPRHTRLAFGTVYEPTYALGGDFYDFLGLPDGRIGVAIADVVGKGIPASLLMASVRSALRVWAYSEHTIEEAVAGVNRQLCRDTLMQEFVTLFYGVFSADGGTLTYCNAGHDPPLLARGGRITQLDAGGMLVGTVPEATYQSAVVTLEPGDAVLLYTDGAVDAMNFIDERFGRERLAESFVRYTALRAEAIAPNVLWDVRRFIGLADQVDDITMVSVKVSG